MTEHDMQNVVAFAVHGKTDRALVPNCKVLGHEADLIRLTASLQVWEYEIKVSRADFLADAKKTVHAKLSWTFAGNVGDNTPNVTPQRFYYAVLDGVADVDDLPPYAGLIVVHPDRDPCRQAVVVKSAPRVHSMPATDRVRRYLERGQIVRYWQERDGRNAFAAARRAALDEQRAYNQRVREAKERRDRDQAEWEARRA